jgi:hypothetical protein
MSTTYDTGPLLPLGQGTLTLNECGIPITIVCTRADLMDATGDELGMKGGGWEERTDWIQQVLRTISLACEWSFCQAYSILIVSSRWRCAVLYCAYATANV